MYKMTLYNCKTCIIADVQMGKTPYPGVQDLPQDSQPMLRCVYL